MKKLLLIILYFTFSIIMNAQSPTFQWARTMGGNTDDYGYSIVADAAGNVYSTGSFNGTVDFDPGVGVFNLTSLGFCDIFILKVDANGNFIWAKQFGGSAYEEALNIKLDTFGNIYTTGYFQSTVDFDPGVGTYTLSNSNNSDIFISKLDMNGNFIWAKKFGGFAIDEGSSLTTDLVGNVYTTGYFQGIVDFDPGISTYTLQALGDADVFVSKLDANGNFIWAKKFGSPQADVSKSINVDAFGNVYTTGSYSGNTDFDPGVGTFFLFPQGFNDLFISKLDASGNFIWAKSIGSGSSDAGFSILTDSQGNSYTTGNYAGVVDFDPGNGVYNLSSLPANYGMFILKLSSAGNFVWAKNVAGAQGTCITLDNFGQIYTTGNFLGTCDFDPGPATVNMTPTGIEDNFILRLDTLGNFVWAKQLEGTSNDLAHSVYVDAASNVYTTGFFRTTVDFDPGIGVANNTSQGLRDAFIHKMGQCIPPSSPINTTASSNLTICANQNTTLSATATGTINWFSTSTSTVLLGTGSNFVTSSLSIGTYTFYAEAFTCTNSATRSPIIVTVNNLPDITCSSSSTLLCLNETATLTAVGANSYTWNQGGTSSTIIVTPTITTNYTVTGMDQYGCENIAVITININECVGIGKTNPDLLILKLFPNPAKDILNIELKNSNNKTLKMQLLNSLGQIVLADFFLDPYMQINIVTLNSGLYFLKLIDGNKVVKMQKIIIE